MSTATLDEGQRVQAVEMRDRRQQKPLNVLRGSGLIRRRVADSINEAFQLALARDDILTAERLLAILDKIRARDRMIRRVDRRHADPLLELARRELESRKSGRRRNL